MSKQNFSAKSFYSSLSLGLKVLDQICSSSITQHMQHHIDMISTTIIKYTRNNPIMFLLISQFINSLHRTGVTGEEKKAIQSNIKHYGRITKRQHQIKILPKARHYQQRKALPKQTAIRQNTPN